MAGTESALQAPGFSGVEQRLPGGQCLAEYVFIGHTGSDLLGKTRVLPRAPRDINDIPAWHCEGLSTGNSSTASVHLQPRRTCPDPFRGDGNILVLCDTYSPQVHPGEDLTGRVHPTNNRFPCSAVMEAASCSAPQFSVEQQYTLLEATNMWPIGERDFTANV